MLTSKNGTQVTFEPTHWSLVLRAADLDSSRALEALATLCRQYWFPIYAFIRRRGWASHDAQDLTQGFFLHLIEHRTLGRVVPGKGRFRTFLLASLTYYLNDERDRRNAGKRGGGVAPVSFDGLEAEELFQVQPDGTEAPELRFDRDWAFAIVEMARARLRAEYAAAGKAAVFAALESSIAGGDMAGVYPALAGRLGMNEGAVKVALLRLRRRFGGILRDEIARTVADAAGLDDELRYLLAVLDSA